MGKILSSFTNGFAGAVSHSIDNIILPMANKSGAAIAFGVPVALDEEKTGVVPFNGNTHTAADFVGVTVRNPAKTPDTYGSNVGSYGPNDLVEILVRGHIIVRLASGTAAMGSAIGIVKSTGLFTANSGETVVTLNNVTAACPKDSANMTEIILKTRNVV